MTIATEDWQVLRGQTIDETRSYSATGPNPTNDGSWFLLLFKAAREDAESVLVFDSRDPNRALTVEGWDGGTLRVTLAFRASRAETLALPAGTYQGDLMHARPRPANNFGPQYVPIVTITITVV